MSGLLATVALLGAVHAPAPATGPAGYYYATGFSVASAADSAQFYVQPQTMPDPNDHSITEFWVTDAARNAVEIGVMTDPGWFGTPKPVLFTDSWTKGNFNGFSNNGFVSTSTVKPNGPAKLPTGWQSFGFSFSGGKMSVSYQGKSIGYYPSTYWKGGWGKAVGDIQVFGETYNQRSGEALPSMDGQVRNSADQIFTYLSTSPYKVKSHSATGFTFGL